MCPKVTTQYKNELREKILESAIECFAKTGFDRTKMDDIANLSDVSKGTLYLYFKSKEDLFYGICQSSLKKIKDQLNGMLITKENLAADAEKFYDYFQKEVNPYHNLVLLEMSVMATRNPRLRKVLMQHRVNRHQVISEFIEVQIKKGFARKDVDKDAIASGLIGLYEGLVINKVMGVEDSTNRKAWSDTIRAIFAGIG
ncbi:MAG TPA: TetR/AcrR family transcriptional regulator [Nitrososphaera sp.]|jgi:TetR/AcrR family transcriptional repressor of uid operon|nr:TetR/AcrR family transcriptional regulator [Nitrososphaera sp.]